MKLTTLCYLEQNGKWLMLHRTKKHSDPNAGKWIGVGGKLEQHESPDECIRREIREETGLTAGKLELRGIVTFVLPRWEDELSFVYTCSEFSGEMLGCDEGELRWVAKEDIFSLNLWPGDPYFLRPLLAGERSFSLKLIYDAEDALVSAVRD